MEHVGGIKYKSRKFHNLKINVDFTLIGSFYNFVFINFAVFLKVYILISSTSVYSLHEIY